MNDYVSGNVHIDERDVSEVPLKTLRAKIGYLTQVRNHRSPSQGVGLLDRSIRGATDHRFSLAAVPDKRLRDFPIFPKSSKHLLPPE